MKKQLLALGISAAVTLPAFAGNFYVSGDFGNADYDGGPTKTSYEVGGGYDFNKYVGVELAYENLGKVSFYDPDYDVDGKAEFTALNTSLVLKYPFNQSWSVFGRVGSSKVTAKVSVTGYGSSSDDSNYDLVGVGVSYATSDKLSIRLEYKKYQDLDISTTNVGLKYAF